MMKHVGRATMCALAVLPWASPAMAGFTIGVNVQGTTISELPPVNSGFEFIPPDTMGAVGPNRFAEFTNGTFAVYKTSNGALVGSRESMTQFWQNAGVGGLSNDPATGTGTTDPHILYDKVSDRWFAVAIDTPASGANRYLVAVSNSNNPAGGWTGFGITSNTSGRFADYPTVGIDKGALYVASNNFGPNSENVGLLIVPKAGLLAATPTVASAQIIQNINPNKTGFSAEPIVDYNGASGADHTLVSAFNATHIATSTVVNPLSGSATIAGPNLLAAANVVPNLGRQPNADNTIDTGDSRIAGSVVKEGANLWAVNAVEHNGAVALQWFRIDAASKTVSETGFIGDTNHDYYYGSIAVNAHGDVVIGYTRSGPNEFASSYASVGSFDGTTTSFAGPTLLAAGAGNYDITFGGNRNRWGDYSQTTIDPNNPLDFWTIQEYASATNVWSTRITEIDITPAVTTPEPGSLVMMAGLGLGGLVTLARRRLASRA